MEEFDLISDMGSAPWFIEKVADLAYAQNLYAALCNNEFQKQDTWTVLKNNTWACTWRSAGGIVAELRNSGEDYLDFYCSGMGGIAVVVNDKDNEQLEKEFEARGYVSEGTITEEICADLGKLGWIVVTDYCNS